MTLEISFAEFPQGKLRTVSPLVKQRQVTSLGGSEAGLVAYHLAQSQQKSVAILGCVKSKRCSDSRF